MANKLKYPRVLLKLGGEALSGPQGFGVDPIQAVSVFSQSATTAYAGVDRAAQPSEGETFLVSAAASSVGSLGNQF